jgi:glycosyltransferase involved in cell wall biosynthesis
MGAADEAFGAHFMLEPVIPEATVVIASHRQDYIRKCVECFTENISGQSPVEVIVVADYPIESLAATYPSVQWAYCRDKSISMKRNIGVARSQGPIVGFIDDDCRSLDNWANNAIGFMQNNPDHAGVAGQTMVERCEGISYPVNEFKRLEIPSFRTNNIFYRKDIIVKIGSFDERFSLQREDIDLAFSIMEMGYAIGYCPDIKVLHRCRHGERWDLLKNCINRRFDPLLYKKHEKLYRKWIKTPFTPSIAFVSIAFCLFAIGCGFGGVFFGIVASLPAVCSLVMGIKRNFHKRIDVVQVLYDWAAYIAAPFALVGALVYGSMKFKKLLIV